MLSLFSRRVLLALPVAATPPPLPPCLLRCTHRVSAATAIGSAGAAAAAAPRGALVTGASLRTFTHTAARLRCTAGVLCCTPVRLSVSNVVAGTARQPRRRLHGTVTAFKHRRGYGFVLAEGVVPPASHADAVVAAAAAPEAGGTTEVAAREDGSAGLHETYFFTRSALGGAFYVMEGERVSFNVAMQTPKAHRVSSADDHGAADGAEAALELGKSEAPSAARPVAVKVRCYDAKTGRETPTAPQLLHGIVMEWDAHTQSGTVAELDLRGKLNSDAPRFPIALEDADLHPETEIYVGRCIRFCLEAVQSAGNVLDDAAANDAGEEATLKARRWIVDRYMELQHKTQGTAPLVSATAAPEVRLSGTVREMNGASFGFVRDDVRGESIFFHISAVLSPAVRVGDRVTYIVRESPRKKHQGRRECFDVVVDGTAPLPLLEEVDGTAAGGAPAQAGRRSSSSSATRTTASRANEEFDFDLLD
ncbi:Cold-shock DNA-binding domain containing protein [Novymonas esmeraldas]|uniref:Cold-shock DNA-binding domain containing protein n=1 Tax=Novymonas esmeraldas TaxID=1808958 RepID=A0AAW0F770_9TRYP